MSLRPILPGSVPHRVTMRHVVCLLASAVLLGCNSPDSVPTARPLLARSVTPAVLSQVSAQGEFLLSQGDAGTAPGVNADSAKHLAAAFWHDAAPWFAHGVEADRGGSIDVAALRPCARAYYVTSAYSSPPIGAPTVVVKAVGPHWLVGMCDQGTEEVVISVSTSADDLVSFPSGQTG